MEDRIKGILERNGFKANRYGQYANGDVIITIEEDHYIVSNYSEEFGEWLDWFSPDLTVYSLMGFLSWNNYIERGYKR